MHDFSNIFSTYYYHKLINLPTRERKQSSTLSDNIYTNISGCYNTGSSRILRFLTESDHYPIFTMRKNVLPHEPIQYITKIIHNQQNIQLQAMINYYAEPLTYLINQSISQGIFPEELKLAKVLPIFKCEDEQLVQN